MYLFHLLLSPSFRGTFLAWVISPHSLANMSATIGFGTSPLTRKVTKAITNNNFISITAIVNLCICWFVGFVSNNLFSSVKPMHNGHSMPWNHALQAATLCLPLCSDILFWTFYTQVTTKKYLLLHNTTSHRCALCTNLLTFQGRVFLLKGFSGDGVPYTTWDLGL